MKQLTLKTGAVLVLVGLVGYGYSSIQSGAPAHFTALIPSIIGIVLTLLSFFQPDQGERKGWAIVATLIVATIGVLGSFGGLTKLPTLLSGGELARPLAVAAQSATAIVLIFFLAASFRLLRYRGFA